MTDEKQPTLLERIKTAETKIESVIEGWNEFDRAVAYRQLYALGLRISNVDAILRGTVKLG